LFSLKETKTYYLRVKPRNGKQLRESLHTQNFNVARERMRQRMLELQVVTKAAAGTWGSLVEPLWVAKTLCSFENLDVSPQSVEVGPAMLDVIFAVLRALLSGVQPHSRLVLENLALRHQLAVLKRPTHKPKLSSADRLLWVGLRRLWPQWPHALLLFQPQTVIAWHRLGFRLFWRWKSRACDGRPSLDGDLVALIRQMWQANST
jgi:hypothetical protein